MIEESESRKALLRKPSQLSCRLSQPKKLNMMEEFVRRLRHRNLIGGADCLAAGMRCRHLLLAAALPRHPAATCLLCCRKRS